MFHSSGTANGNVEKMNRWKHTMRTAAPIERWMLVENSRTSGATISTRVPRTCAMPEAILEGRRSSGYLR